MAPLTPFSISEALHASLNRTGISGPTRDRPIDLLAVVTNVEQPFDWLTLIHVVDRTGEAYIAYYGKNHQQTIIKSLEISNGDIVRFNQVSVPSQLGGNDNNFVTFHHCASDEPEGGMDFCRLARIVDESGSVAMEIIPPPPDFETRVQAIQELSKWMQRTNVRRLGGTLCQLQRIASIQAGMTLHLRANVEAVAMMDQQQQLFKRKKVHPKRQRPPLCCYVTLGDYTGSISFVLEHPFLSMISKVHSAYGNRLGLAITHSRAIRKTNDEIVLIPTNRSILSIIERLELPSTSEPTPIASQAETIDLSPVVKRHEQVFCTIRDMIVQGISLVCQKDVYLGDDSATRLHSLLRMDDLSYQDVLLELEEVCTGKKYTTVAHGNVVEKLLGDTKIDSWKSSVKLQRIVILLVRGLLEEKLPLLWTVEHLLGPLHQSSIIDVNLEVI